MSAEPPATSPATTHDLSHIAPRDKAEILAQALPYIRKFHGKTIVIKYGGNAMTDPSLQQDFAEDVVLLKLVGMNPVVVHGGGPQIEDALAKIGKKGTFIQGMRVTDEETMEVVEWVLAGQVQQDIVGLINVAGGKAVGLTGRDGGLIRAHKLKLIDHKDPTKVHDLGQVGEIESIDPAVVDAVRRRERPEGRADVARLARRRGYGGAVRAAAAPGRRPLGRAVERRRARADASARPAHRAAGRRQDAHAARARRHRAPRAQAGSPLRPDREGGAPHARPDRPRGADDPSCTRVLACRGRLPARP